MDELRTQRQGDARAARREHSAGHVGHGIEPCLKDDGGAIISAVTPDGAADRAGLKRGDVIKTSTVSRSMTVNTLRNHVADAAPGSSADVTIVRDGAEKAHDREARRSLG